MSYPRLKPRGFLSRFSTGEDTQGKAVLMEAVQIKGLEPPRHSHPEPYETFYVINGKL